MNFLPPEYIYNYMKKEQTKFHSTKLPSNINHKILQILKLATNIPEDTYMKKEYIKDDLHIKSWIKLQSIINQKILQILAFPINLLPPEDTHD